MPTAASLSKRLARVRPRQFAEGDAAHDHRQRLRGGVAAHARDAGTDGQVWFLYNLREQGSELLQQERIRPSQNSAVL